MHLSDAPVLGRSFRHSTRRGPPCRNRNKSPSLDGSPGTDSLPAGAGLPVPGGANRRPMEGLDDNRICGTVPEPADEHGASLRRHVGRPSRSRPLRYACLARRGPSGMAGHAAPFSPILGSRHLCLPLRQRNPAPASPAGPGLVVPALRGPREHGHGGVCGHPGASGHHRPRPRLHAPGGKRASRQTKG